MTKGLALYLDNLLVDYNFQYNFTNWNVLLVDKFNGIDANERQNDNVNCGIIALAQCFMLATTGVISKFTQLDFKDARNMYAAFLVDKLSKQQLSNFQIMKN